MPTKIRNTNSSRLVLAELLLIDGVEFWDILDLPIYIPQVNDITYTTQDGDRLDILAQTFYQEPLLNWIIAWANNIELIPPIVPANVQLIIPDPVFVKTKLIKGLVTSQF